LGIYERKLSAVDELCEDLIQFLKPFDIMTTIKNIQGYVQKLKEHREKAKRSTRKRLVKETPLGIQAKAEFLASLPEDRRGALEQGEITRRPSQKSLGLW